MCVYVCDFPASGSLSLCVCVRVKKEYISHTHIYIYIQYITIFMARDDTLPRSCRLRAARSCSSA